MTETEEYCTICGEEYNDKTKYTLSCKDSFHYDCLIESFKINFIHKKRLRTTDRCCPYCQQRVLPLNFINNNCKFYLGVHKASLNPDSKSNSQHEFLSHPYFCKGICKNGNKCKFKAKYNGYCGHHKQVS